MLPLVCLFVIVLAVKANELGYYEHHDPTFLPIKSTFDIFQDKKPDDCPPCFNCMLPGFECLHFANCSEYDGKCNCPPGFGGVDCKQPCNVMKPPFVIMHLFTNIFFYIVCGALPDGHNRQPRENDHCDCPEGWEGINCNGE